jgi:glycosyltransferase involved in cell wall biosynthesis
MKLSVIIPVFNEEKNIEKIAIDLKKELGGLALENYEIIAVDDGSRDNSLEALKKIEGLVVLNHAQNKGYGASLKTGIKNSHYDWILIIDADGTYPVQQIPELTKNTAKYDLIVGNRNHFKDNAIPGNRKLAKKFLDKFASYLAGQKIPDLNSGLRLFKKEIVLKYWELFPDKFSFTSTLNMICATHGYEICFIPIEYYQRQGKSTLKAFDFFNFLKLVAKLSLFFRPLKVFGPLSLLFLLIALFLAIAFLLGLFNNIFPDVTFIVLCATALQTFFFGLIAEIIIHQK